MATYERTRRERLRMWWDDNYVFVIVGFLFILMVGTITLGMIWDGEHRDRFMAQCSEDHKEYECDAMWRAGEDHTTVVATPVIIR